MSARSLMTMRCTIERDRALGVDGFNQPAPPHWEIVGTSIHCWIWAGSTAGTRTGGIDGILTITSKTPGAVFPLGTDIKEGDRLRDIQDRRGRATAFGMMPVDSVLPRKTHLEVRLVDNA